MASRIEKAFSDIGEITIEKTQEIREAIRKGVPNVRDFGVLYCPVEGCSRRR